MIEEVQAAALKRAVALRVHDLMKKKNLSKSALAAEMRTSRAAIHRLLDPENTSCHSRYSQSCCSLARPKGQNRVGGGLEASLPSDPPKGQIRRGELLTSDLHLLVLPSRGYLNLPSQGNELKPQQHSLSGKQNGE